MSSDSRLRVTFLGTGTSMGIPVITCDCPVCTSDDPRNRRLRASLLLEWDVEATASAAAPDDAPPDDVARVLVDTSTDLRQQCLRADVRRVDGVVYTHGHADHVLGLDELRIFNFVQERAMPIWADAETMAALRRMFAYAFDPEARGVPRLDPRSLEEDTLVHGRRLQAIPVEHGGSTVRAIRVGGFAYVTDCSGIPEAAAERLRDAEILVIDALRRRPHPSHFSLEEALREIERLRPDTAYLTHLSHVFDHAELESELPAGVRVAHDGLVLSLPGDSP